jgi:uncharacterized LabA/DUF88 family protein
MRAAIFIDGGYFLSRLKDEGTQVDIDYVRLAEYLLAPCRRDLPVDLLRAYFYHCPPWMSDEPNKEELRRMESHRTLVDEIESTNRWQVKLGKLERRWDGNEEYFEQKRVDVMLSVDLVRHAAAGHIQHAIVIAGDSDFIPAIAAAKESGVTVSLWGGTVKTIHRDLAWMVDELHRLDWRAFEKNRGNDRPERERLDANRSDRDRMERHDRDRNNRHERGADRIERNDNGGRASSRSSGRRRSGSRRSESRRD